VASSFGLKVEAPKNMPWIQNVNTNNLSCPTEKAMAIRFILLVEDDADDAYLSMRVIEKFCSDKIIVARDGEEANDLLQKMADDATLKWVRLVLLDINLPKISGIGVLQTIRSTPVLRNLPVVILSSSDDDIDQQRCRELGILDYICKPITVGRLRGVFSRAKDS
jgi:CheY-like chemotaxis protein